MSEGTRSVPRNSALSRLATCVNASCPNSSLRRQQNIQRNRRIHRLDTLRWRADSVGPTLSLLSRLRLYLDEPSGSKTSARPNRIRANTTQLKTTIAGNNQMKIITNLIFDISYLFNFKLIGTELLLLVYNSSII